MIRIPMSPAGAAVLRALLKKAGLSRDEMRLASYRAADWRSLTFAGERHELDLCIPGIDRMPAIRRLVDGLADEQFDIPGQIVADISGSARCEEDGRSITVRIEALTIAT